MRNAQLIALALVASACTPATPMHSPSSAPSETTTPVVSPPSATAAVTATPRAASLYRAQLLFETPTVPSAIAASDTQVFVAQVQLGARPNETLSHVVVVSPSGGSPATVGGSQTAAGVSISGLAFHDGTLFMSEASNGSTRQNGVFRLAAGTASPVAGGPSAPADLNSGNGDGGPALSAAVQGPAALAFATNGDLYISEPGDSRIRLVHGGTITTYAGGNGVGDYSASPSGTIATAKLGLVGLIAAGRDGTVFAAQQSRNKWIARIETTGKVSTIANDFPVTGLAIDVNGDLLATDPDAGRIMRFGRGGGAPMVAADGLGTIVALASAHDGSLYIAHWLPHPPTQAVIYRITRLVPVP